MVQLTARVDSRPVCPYCREPVGAGPSCFGCGVAYHAECRVELGRCATLGCAPAVVTYASVHPPTAPGAVDALLHGLSLLLLAVLVVVPSFLESMPWSIGTSFVLTIGSALGLMVVFLPICVRGSDRAADQAAHRSKS